MRVFSITAALIAASPPFAAPAAAQESLPCKFPKRIMIVHGNNAVARMAIRQVASQITGKGMEGNNSGVLRGELRGREVEFTIRWSNGHRGFYTGRISGSGTLSGQNTDATNMRSQTTWFVREAVPC